jgi:hypothetical protein
MGYKGSLDLNVARHERVETENGREDGGPLSGKGMSQRRLNNVEDLMGLDGADRRREV